MTNVLDTHKIDETDQALLAVAVVSGLHYATIGVNGVRSLSIDNDNTDATHTYDMKLGQWVGLGNGK